MQFKDRFSLTHITLYGLLVLSVFLIAIGIKSLLSARAQGLVAQTTTGALVTLSAEKEFFDTTDQVTVHVAITNPKDYSIKVLKWFIPLEGIEGPLFSVTRDGEPVTYLGAMVKRPAPTEEDYITLTAGESLTSDVILSDYFDLSVSGNYEVRYDVTSIQLYVAVDNLQLDRTGHLVSNTLGIFIKGSITPKPGSVTPTPTPPIKYPNYPN